MVDLAYQAFTRDKTVAIRATGENLGVSEAVAKHIVEINPTLSLPQMVDPKFELSLRPGPGVSGAPGMIQMVGSCDDVCKVFDPVLGYHAACAGLLGDPDTDRVVTVYLQ